MRSATRIHVDAFGYQVLVFLQQGGQHGLVAQEAMLQNAFHREFAGHSLLQRNARVLAQAHAKGGGVRLGLNEAGTNQKG
jgi:hypothetical protein